MECPKCHSKIADNQAVCPVCKKVVLLECPNCLALGESAVCEKCGYNILVKCAKCSKIMPFEKGACTKCGFSLKTSLAYQECETDEFAAILVRFGNLKIIRKSLKTREMYSKFQFRLKNLLTTVLKNVDCKLVVYDDFYVINMNKELSFPTSSNKAVRLAIKIINAFVELNMNLMSGLGTPLGLKLSIIKKSSEELLDLVIYDSNVKQLSIKKNPETHLRGFQVEMDQFVWDNINKDYKTDSLFTIDRNGQSIMFYEVVLEPYVLPPETQKDDLSFETSQHKIKKELPEEENKDLYSFKVFDINAKCSFERATAATVIDKINKLDLSKNGKIITLKSEKSLEVPTKSLVDFYEQKGFKVISVCCTEEMTYKPWGFFEAVFRDCFGFSRHNALIDNKNVNPTVITKFKPLVDFLFNHSIKAMTPEDARFAYMEHFGNFLASLQDTVIIVEGFEFLDDTSIQTLELYFDKFRNIKPNFVFINNSNIALHSKIKGLLRTSQYTEFSLKKSSIDSLFSMLKSDAGDFINSFYFEKIKENYKGSLIYFENTLEYLKDSGVLIEFENKLIIKNNKSVVLPNDVNGLYKARIRTLAQNPDSSLILAYSTLLGSRMDFATLERLGIQNVEKNALELQNSGFVRVKDNIVYVNNFDLIGPVIKSALKREIEVFLAKTLLAHLGKGLDDTTLVVAMGILGTHKEEYLTLWKNSQFAIKTGDYDAYLKNSLGFLSLVDKIKTNIEPEALEENKKEVYNNILMYLYGYSPSKIYFIENILLMDAIREGDNEKIVKLSNLMLQGALVSANYTDALGLLHNILSRTPNATLLVDGAVNTKFLLLSLVHIEILYNIGNYRLCVDIAEEILNVLNADIIDKVRPASFSLSLFVSHILETLRLAGFAKIYLLDEDLDEFFERIQTSLNVEFPEKNCILAVKDFFAGKVHTTGNVENASAFSKVIFLILQEFLILKEKGDYKTFAQNVYQAKLLATDIHQKEIEYFCDLLIAYAYLKTGIEEKAVAIYEDIHENSERNALLNMLLISKYFMAQQKLSSSEKEDALMLMNDALALLQKFDNQAKILFVLFEKLYIETVSLSEDVVIDIDAEEQKLVPFKEQLSLLFE